MEELTLDDLLATVDATVLRLTGGPTGGVVVSDVVILDWTDPHGLRTGALVLGVGVEPEGPAAAALVDRAADAGAAAIIVRSDDDLPAALMAAVDRAGIALLAAPLGVAWGQLYALLRTALSSVTGSGRQSSAQGVPVGDLFSLADAIATAVGGPVTIEDPQWRVLAYSNLDQAVDEPRRHTILGRTPPAEWQERIDEAGIAAAMRRGQSILHFNAEGLAPRIIAPIRAGDELLGAIWLAVGEQPLAPDAEEQLQRAGELAAMHLVAHRAAEDLNRRGRGASVRDVLDGHEPPGHRVPPLPLSLIAFEPREVEPGRWRSVAERVLSVVALFAESAHRDAMCALVDDRLWALVPTSPTRGVAGLVELGQRVTGRVGEILDLELLAAVAPPVDDLRDVPASRAVVERTLRVIARDPALPPVAQVDTVRAQVVLDELLELATTRPSLQRGPLPVLADGGRVETLRAYLDAHGDVAAAATRLGVHANTLRYRLRRIVETTGLDLSDPDERLVTEFQLRLIE